ncbi:MAG: outer membrane homotrimeric porin, partial [Desulfovibrio sp.]
MKRIVVLATMLAMVLGFASMAAAADLTATGSWKIVGQWVDNEDFDKSSAESDFDVRQRLRTQFNFTANENLMGALQIEVGSGQWGNRAFGFDADQTVIEVKSAYINFVWPNTDVSITAGLMPLALPAGPAGSMVLDDDVAALVVSAPITDNVSLLAGWARPYASHIDGNSEDTFMDVSFLAVPVALDGVSFTPYAAYVKTGSEFLAGALTAGVNPFGMNRTTNGWVSNGYWGLFTQNASTLDIDDNDTGFDIWYGGLTFDMTLFDPITIGASFVYGSLDAGADNLDRSGWLADLAVTYTGLDFVTPELFFTYSSGEDGNASKGDGGSERLPTLGGDYGFGNYMYNSGGMAIDNGLQSVGNMVGYWALGLTLKDISFLEGLTHSLTIMYAEGTNDKSIGDMYGRNDEVVAGAAAQSALLAATNGNSVYGATLTEEDSIWEISLVNQY